MKRWLRRIALGFFGLLLLLVLVGSVWERSQRSSAAKQFPPRGQLVDIGGRRIHLDCRGTGSPTVVLIHGLDTYGSLAWTAVHDSIGQTTRTCAYSRAGVMWSDPGPAVTAEGVADDLHAALQNAGERAPFILVGHSLGGPYSLTYTRRFGDQVAGLVMVDASHPEQFDRFKTIAPEAAGLALTPMKILSSLTWTGGVRLIANQSLVAMPHQDSLDVQAAKAYLPLSVGGAYNEAAALAATLVDAGTARTLGDRPLVVLTAMMPMSDAERATMKLTEEKGKEFKNMWKAMHDEEASWSTRSEHVLVPDASHYIQFHRPDLVIRATRSVIDSVRADVTRLATRGDSVTAPATSGAAAKR